LWRGQWRDAKGFRFYLMDGERIVHVLSWHQVQTEDQLGEALKQVKESSMIPEDQVRLCVVADGASWIWKHVKALFPHACQVLDYYHCAEYLHRVAKAQYGASLQALEWVEATMTRLYVGKLPSVLGGLGRMQATSEEALKRWPIVGTISMSTEAAPLIKSSGEGAIPWAVEGSNRPTSACVTCG
jgi:hypothetical protein